MVGIWKRKRQRWCKQSSLRARCYKLAFILCVIGKQQCYTIKQKTFYTSKSIWNTRKVETTLLYIQLAETIFKNLNDDYIVGVASTKDEIKSLLEAGFEYICEKNEFLYFRKRK